MAVISELKKRLEALKKKYIQNEIDVTRAEQAAQEAADLTDKAEQVNNIYGQVWTSGMKVVWVYKAEQVKQSVWTGANLRYESRLGIQEWMNV